VDARAPCRVNCALNAGVVDTSTPPPRDLLVPSARLEQLSWLSPVKVSS
jgi:hypothetical protein